MVNWCLLFSVGGYVIPSSVPKLCVARAKDLHLPLYRFHENTSLTYLHIQVMLCSYICTSLNSLYTKINPHGQLQVCIPSTLKYTRELLHLQAPLSLSLSHFYIVHHAHSCIAVHHYRFIYYHDNVHLRHIKHYFFFWTFFCLIHTQKKKASDFAPNNIANVFYFPN